ncbi:hypothetical protein FAI40_05660 [Acetobacteraceae bacterium]|nr:hypothetical protein FAI40_05660 [Acetobacteraceae bacterium]
MSSFFNLLKSTSFLRHSSLKAFFLLAVFTGLGNATSAQAEILTSTLNSQEGNYVILTWLSDIPFRASMKDEQDFYDKAFDDDNIHVNAVHLSWDEERTLIKVSQEYNNITRAAFKDRNFWLPLKADPQNYYWMVNVLYFEYDKKGNPRKVPQILYGHSYTRPLRHRGNVAPDCIAYTDIDEINISSKHLLAVINPMEPLARRIKMGESCDLPKITRAFVTHNSPHPKDGHLLENSEMEIAPELVSQHRNGQH